MGVKGKYNRETHSAEIICMLRGIYINFGAEENERKGNSEIKNK
jgi:hypothetical protein